MTSDQIDRAIDQARIELLGASGPIGQVTIFGAAIVAIENKLDPSHCYLG
jgi:hypothetical protein